MPGRYAPRLHEAQIGTSTGYAVLGSNATGGFPTAANASDPGGGTALAGDASGMGFASARSCTVALLNTIVGAGMLGLPNAFAGCGYMLGMLLLVVGAVASAFGLHLLASCATALWGPGPRRQLASFHSVAGAAVPRWAWLIDLAVAIKW